MTTGKPNGWTLREWIEQSKASRYFTGYKLYVIECFNDNERFIKIGRTYCTIGQRFCDTKSMPYQYELIYEIKDDNPYLIFNLENKLKKEYKPHKYKPLIKFTGQNECFSMEIKDTLKDRLNEYIT